MAWEIEASSQAMEQGTEKVQAAGIGELSLLHPAMVQDIGWPAVIAPDEQLPSLQVTAATALNVEAELVLVRTGEVLARVEETAMAAGEERLLAWPEHTERRMGRHEIRVRLCATEGLSPRYDGFAFTVAKERESSAAYVAEDGKLEYTPDYKGNQILDFSGCGYMGGGVPLPDVPVVHSIAPREDGGDDTEAVQAAIDHVSGTAPGADGFRGALLLRRGVYRIAGTLTIRTSGIVLRGEGQGEDGTVLHAAGPGRRDILRVEGEGRPTVLEENVTEITDQYVPSGAVTFHVADSGSFAVGDLVAVTRRGNQEWISAIDMDTITPRPGSGGTKQWEPFELTFERIITSIQGDRITVDAPIACAIEDKWGGGTLAHLDDSGRIEQIGVENLRVDSDFDPEVTDTQVDGKSNATDPYCADENHAANFVVWNQVKNGWLRDVTGYHLDHSLVTIDRWAKWMTVQDCTVRDMVSIITGGRRYAFHVTGQLSLVQRCDTETARHAFVFDARVCGPNVFLDCESRVDFNASEPHHRWSVGGLYDNVKAVIYIRDRGWMGSGHGWAGANYVTWNTEGPLTVQQPPTAQNYAIGHVGSLVPPFLPNRHDERPRRDGYVERLGEHVEPRSLYRQQLAERTGSK